MIKLKYGNTNTFFIRGNKGGLDPAEYIGAYDNNTLLKSDWELISSFAPKTVFFAHKPEKTFHQT